MQFDLLTIFPEFFTSPLQVSLLGKALQEKKLSVTCHNIRDYTEDKHRKVDDVPYGGGPGMVMKPEPLVRAVEAIRKPAKKSRTILLTPRGKPLTQELAQQWLQWEQILLICGRYEGVDERVSELVVDEEVSIGNYVLSGGEPAALVVLDTVARLIPGVMGNQESLAEESFGEGLLEYPQYTRPVAFRGLEVPEVLREGNHAKIREWRRKQALLKTVAKNNKTS